jgi:DNA replicative helicase MCM subunit Mcm2 (Cdc46/Mcm family)
MANIPVHHTYYDAAVLTPFAVEVCTLIQRLRPDWVGRGHDQGLESALKLIEEALKPKSLEQFDKEVEQWMSHFDDAKKTEWYCTQYELAEHIFNEIRATIYGAEMEREKRKALYLQLKAEFEGDENR